MTSFMIFVSSYWRRRQGKRNVQWKDPTPCWKTQGLRRRNRIVTVGDKLMSVLINFNIYWHQEINFSYFHYFVHYFFQKQITGLNCKRDSSLIPLPKIRVYYIFHSSFMNYVNQFKFGVFWSTFNIFLSF